MRMGFLAGGILGAAAAIYFSRSKHPLVSIGKEILQDRIGNMTNGFTERAKNGETKPASDSEEMNIVSEMVESDPELKKQVNEIMHQEYQ